MVKHWMRLHKYPLLEDNLASRVSQITADQAPWLKVNSAKLGADGRMASKCSVVTLCDQ